MQRNCRRRQTLGSVSVNNPASSGRKSVGGRSNVNPGTRPPRGRVSMIPRVGRENLAPPTPPSSSAKKAMSGNRNRRSSGINNGDRRQSTLPLAIPTKAETRPIADKGFQQACIKKLLDFLVGRGYEYPISHRSLARPSGKDFNNIVTFMLRMIDPNFQDGSMKMEDEVAMNFRAIGYPFPVSKTALVAAGSPHTWPSLLGALAWLMEHIQGLEECTLDTDPTATDNDDGNGCYFDSLEQLENQTDKVFFKYLSKAYTAFLRGDEQVTEELENALADRFERDDAIIEQEIEQVTDKNAVILEQINNLTSGENDLQNYLRKRDGYSTDLEQFHDLIQQMDQHVAALAGKKKDRANDLDQTNRNFSRTTNRVEALKKSIGLQTLSLEDAQKMQNELKGVEEAIERALDSKDEYRKLMWESQSDTDILLSRFESSANRYNAQLGELGLISLGPECMDSAVVLDRSFLDVGDQAKLVGTDLNEMVVPSIQTLRHGYTEKAAERKRLCQETLDQAERNGELFAEALQRVRIVEEKIEQLEETLMAEREAQDSKLDIRSREALHMEEKIMSLRNPAALEEQMAHFERQCVELEALRIKHEKENTKRRKAAFVEIAKACAAMVEFDRYCKAQVAGIRQYQREKQLSYGNIHIPRNFL